ncbi:MAG: ABC transporter permease [Acidimicrobiales bacterium]
MDFSKPTDATTRDASTRTNPETVKPRFKILPPLSPLTYYRRNVTRTLPVGGAILISVFLVAAIVTLLNSVDASITRNYGFISHFSVLTTQMERDVSPVLRARVEKTPQVERIVTALPYFIEIRTIFGPLPVPVYGLEGKDMPFVARRCGVHLAEGRWPARNQPEVVMSRAWAATKDLKIGQSFSAGDDRLPSLTGPQKLVGLLDGSENLALTDRTYLLLEMPELMQRPSYMLYPKNDAGIGALNATVRDLVDHPKQHGIAEEETRFAKLYTYNDLVTELRKRMGMLYTFLAIADILVIGAVALMAGFLANIYFEQRLGEFGLLSAFGFRRELLAKRVVVETGILVVVGWLAGIALTSGVIWLFGHFYMEPRGLVLAPLDSLALRYTIPTPIIVGLSSLATVLLRLYKMDPIAIMERR